MMKRFIALFAAVVVCAATLASCAGGGAPRLDEVRDELVSLIEASYEINDIFFGKGLPTYERGGSYDRKYGLYDPNEYEYAYYEYVTAESPYMFIEQIKEAAEKVYTKDYLEDIYLMAFDGYADSDIGSVTTARYLERGVNLMKYSFGNKDSFNILPGKRLYNFDTLKIVQPSDSEFMNITVDSYCEGDEENILNVNLRLKKTEAGWRLDGPTY